MRNVVARSKHQRCWQTRRRAGKKLLYDCVSWGRHKTLQSGPRVSV